MRVCPVGAIRRAAVLGCAFPGRAPVFAALIAALFVGCGARSGLDGGGARGARPPPADASARLLPSDAGTTRADGGSSVVPADPDVGPDARPSDDPSAAGWVDTPPPDATSDPCCDLEGESFALDDATDTGGPPAVAWNGTSWGVVWNQHFREVDELGHPLAPARATLGGFWPSIAWSAGVYGLAASGAADTAAAALDRDGALLHPARALGFIDADVSRLSYPHRWIFAGIEAPDGSSTSHRLSVRALADDGTLDPEVGSWAFESEVGPRIVGLKSRVTVVGALRDGNVLAWNVTWPPTATPAEPLRVMRSRTVSDSYIEADTYRDDVVIAAMDGRVLRAVRESPWTNEVVAGPVDVAVSGIEDRQPGIAAASDRGFIGLCYPTGPGPAGGTGRADGIELVVTGPDLRPWGLPVRVAGPIENAGGVACAWSGERFVVIWWSAGGDGAFNEIRGQIVRVRF